MHDPSTVVLHDGRFYSYGAGNGLPVSVSDDGWTWRRAGTLMQAATDFCARFLDREYRPVKDITVTLTER